MITTLQPTEINPVPKTTAPDRKTSVLNALASFFHSQKRGNSLPPSIYLYKSHTNFGEYEAAILFQMNSVAEYKLITKNNTWYFELLGADYPGFPPTILLPSVG